MQCSVLYAIFIVLTRALQHISYIYRNMENRKWIIGMSLCMDVFIAKSKKGVHIIRSQPPLIKLLLKGACHSLNMRLVFTPRPQAIQKCFRVVQSQCPRVDT
jgi:hypothetical protein